MTANAAQQILHPQAWHETLRGAYEALVSDLIAQGYEGGRRPGKPTRGF